MTLTDKKPVFINTDAAALTAEMIAWYEKISGKTLYPAQDERLLINLMAYREALVRLAIQDTAEQNLVAFARAPMLDYLGELVGVYRLAAAAARTSLRFKLEEPPATPLVIPAGTRVSARDSIVFATDEAVTLSDTTVSVNATCTERGTLGNGWQPAQISTLLDGINDADLSVTNTEPSTGGSDPEEDAHLRERIRLAPASFSNAGSRDAYRFHAMSAHQDIRDVAVMRPIPGTVALYPLVNTGLPSDTLLALVNGACSDEKVRPLTDTVKVASPVKVTYRIEAAIRVYAGYDSAEVMAAVKQSTQRYVDRQAAQLGRDIVPSQIQAVLSVNGVYSVELKQPTQQVVKENEWPWCENIDLTLVGVVND